MILKLRNGFTLAEVLITLGIIGVVASITLPILINNYKEKQRIASFKKIYSVLSQANQQLNYEYDFNWTNQCSSFDDKCFRNLFATKIKTVKICDRPIAEGCQKNSMFLSKNDIESGINVNFNWPGFITNNGYSIKFRFHNQSCNSTGGGYNNLPCGWVQIDTNGLKAPNVVGKDIFFLNFYNDGTIRGWRKGVTSTDGKYDASLGDYTILENDCKKGTGVSCSAIYLMK